MSDLEISKVVIHELVKEQHKAIQPSNLREEVLDATSEPVKKLVDGVVALYGKRNNSAQYGIFRGGMSVDDFPKAFGAYAKKETPDDKSFMELTLTAMKALYEGANGALSSSGGYMLYADYLNTRKRYFLVAMIKQKDGITLSGKLEPEELTQLDLNRLHQAAKINFTKLSEYGAADEKGRQELNYLSFVSPSASKSAAGYFISSLGCSRGTASAAATKTLIRESIAFFKGEEALKTHHLDFKKDLMEYLTQQEDRKVSVKLSEIEKIARKYIPAEEPGQADALADRLISHLNSEECAVPVEFSVSKTELAKHRQIRYKADDWELNFERGALGESNDASVYYEREMNRLIINNLPDPMVKQIKDELEGRATG